MIYFLIILSFFNPLQQRRVVKVGERKRVGGRERGEEGGDRGSEMDQKREREKLGSTVVVSPQSPQSSLINGWFHRLL